MKQIQRSAVRLLNITSPKMLQNEFRAETHGMDVFTCYDQKLFSLTSQEAQQAIITCKDKNGFCI